MPESGTAHLTPFGANVKSRIGMGSKYVFKPDSNPPVGGYNTDRGFDSISPSKRSAIIREPTSTYRRPQEKLPEPGSYDGHLVPFGKHKMSNVTMGSKYEFKPDKNPPVGGYFTDRAFS